uniref:Uncharacterized protein n=1 Tax=Arundo donax TaxID=35708 RepID=A0A0A9BI97_ARUDO
MFLVASVFFFFELTLFQNTFSNCMPYLFPYLLPPTMGLFI